MNEVKKKQERTNLEIRLELGPPLKYNTFEVRPKLRKTKISEHRRVRMK